MLARALPCSTICRRATCTRLHCGSTLTAERASVGLLGWATDKNLLYEQLAVQIQQHPQHGRCLVATEDIEPDSVILSVCTDKVFMSRAADDLEMHWAAEMALRLLQERHMCSPGSIGSIDCSQDVSSGYWKPWIDSLPQHVVTPVEFTEEEVRQLVVPSAVQAVLNMRKCLEDCYAELQDELQQIGCGWQDFLWAVQVLHSRCFYEPGSRRHLAVPGIDMANHSSSNPNATVRILHSPGACQGLAALEEVAPAVTKAVGSSYFQLLAGPDGVAAGEQVCIAYGQWPSEPFLLLFGFIPKPNPYDALTIFSSIQDMASCYMQCLVDQSSKQPLHSSGGVEGCLTVWQEFVTDEDFTRALHQHVQISQQHADAHNTDSVHGPQGFTDLIVNASGVDARLQQALDIIHQAVECAVVQTAQQHMQANGSSHQVGLASSAKNTHVHLGTVLQYRLLQLHSELQQSCLQQQTPDQTMAAGVASVTVDADVADCAVLFYDASPRHVDLIHQYCSSKAALALQLAPEYC